jgi:hypothetical protein
VLSTELWHAFVLKVGKLGGNMWLWGTQSIYFHYFKLRNLRDRYAYKRMVDISIPTPMYHCTSSHFIFIFLRQKANMPTPKHMMQLTTWQVLCQVERRIYDRESNRQPLPWDLGISPPSSNNLGSCWTKNTLNIMLSYVNLTEPGLMSTIQGSICLQCQLKF